MKKAKRILSLAIAGAMVLGMMVMGSGAAHSDVTEKHNREAIAVVSAAKIMGANSTFDPDNLLTRGELAVVVTNLMGWNPNSYKGAASVFTDVPDWAAGYVGAMYSNGMTSGIGNNMYGVTNHVTAVDAALMLQKAIGYFAFQSEFSSDWNETSRTIINNASKIGLLDGVGAGATDKLTRNQLALMVLNALETPMVKGEEQGGGTNITIEGWGSIQSPSRIVYTEITGDRDDYANSKDKDEIAKQYLIENLFGEDFTRDVLEDDMGRKAEVWLDDDGNVIYSTAKAPNYTLFCKEDGKSLYDLIDEEKLTKKMDNEDDFEDVDISRGDVIELYIDEDNEAEAVIYTYMAAKIDSVEECDKDDHDEWIDAGAKYILEIDGEEYFDIQLKGFNSKTYKKGAYVVFMTEDGINPAAALEQVNDGEDVYDTYIATTKTGAIETVHTSGEYVRLGGKKYEMMYDASLKAMEKIKPGDEWILILDTNGYVLDAVAGEKAAASLDDVYIYVDDYVDSKWKDVIYAVLVDMDGKIHEVEVDSLGTVKAGALVVVEKNSSKKVVLEAWDYADAEYDVQKNKIESLEDDQTRLSVGSNVYRLNSSTKYLIITGEASDIEADVKSSGVNYASIECTNYIIAEKGEVAVQYVVLYDPDETLEEATAISDDLIYIASDDPAQGKDFYIVTAVTEAGKVIDEEDDGIQVTESSWEDGNGPGWYSYSKNSKGYYVVKSYSAKPANKNGVWNDKGGVFTDAVVDASDLYVSGKTSYLTVGGVVDIDVNKSMKFVDLDDKTSGYKKSISSLDKLFEVLEDDKYPDATIQVLVKEDDGVTLVILTDI